MGKFYLLSALLFFSHCISAQSYTWNVSGVNGDFQDATNWTPNRVSPSLTDILVFDNGSNSGNVTNVPNQTIGQLQVSNNTSVILEKVGGGIELTISGQVTIAAGSLLAFDGTLRANGPVSVDGSYQINEGGYATGTGTWTYGAAGTLIFNNSSGPYVVDDHVYWPVANGPVNVTVQNAGGIQMNVSRTVNGLFQTTAGVTNGNNLTLNGTCQINNGGYFAGSPTYGASSLLKYNTGVPYGRGDEWGYVGVGTIGVTAGYPNDVQLSNNTTLNVPNGFSNDKACARDLTVDNGSNLYADGGGGSVNLIIGRNFTMSGNVSLGSAIGGDMHINGSFTRNAGIFTTNNRAVYFEGNSGNQTITGTTTFDYLRINKTSGNVVLNSQITVNQELSLTSGNIISASASLLTLIDNATYTGGSVNSLVEGPMKKIGEEDFIFPVGAGQIYAPLGLSGGSGAATTDEFTAEYVRGNPQMLHGSCPSNCENPLDHISYVEYWRLNRDNGTATKQISLAVHRYSFSKVLSNTYVSRWNTSIGKWTNEPTTISFGPVNCTAVLECGTIISNNATGEFGDFTLATDLSFAVNPLPIKLVRFDALKQSATRALISWELAACCSKDARFELEKSTDGLRYTLLAALAGSETSRFYNYTDNELAPGVNYYRLKATDEAGAVTYSRVATVINADGEQLRVSLSPNPAGSQAMLVITAAKNTTMQFSIISSSGVVMRQWQQRVLAGTQTMATDLQALPAGVYQLLGRGEGGRVTLQFVKL